MDKINAPAAWNASTGSSAVVVADIDTGIDYNHPDLAANLWVNTGEIAGNNIDDDGNGYVDDVYGIDAYNADGDPLDDHGHGTHTAGTIGACGNNGAGVVGVNWSVKIMALKFLDEYGSGTTAGAIECFQYALMMKNRGVNIRVTNNSWGGGGYDQALFDAINALGAEGVINVCAAGNDGMDTDASLNYPSCFDSDSIISIAASDQNDDKAYFSNWGKTTVDIAAPGVDVLSTFPDNQYYSWAGTSMASPHVAGAVALLCSIDGNQTGADLKDRLLSTADFVNWPYYPTVSNGRLNIGNAVNNTYIKVNAHRLQINEGATATLDVKLSRDPGGTVTVETVKESGDPDISITDGSSLVFDSTNWDQFQSVTLAATPDEDNIDGEATIRCTAQGWAAAAVIAEEYDSTRPDYMTEQFGVSSNNFDLSNKILTFVPYEGSDYYQPYCTAITSLPTDPAGGTALNLYDDDCMQVFCQPIPFYGQAYDSFYIGSNGYITFWYGDTDFIPSYFNHFQQPRISALYDDLLLPSGGEISYKVLYDRVAVTYLDVPEWGQHNKNTVQVEMFFSGVIRIAYLGVDSPDALGGLSAGMGVPSKFHNSDLSAYPSDIVAWPPVAGDDEYWLPANMKTTVPAPGVAVNDCDLNGNSLTLALASSPSHGVLVFKQDGSFAYTPEAAFMGEDSFTYTASDGQLTSSPGKVTLNIQNPGLEADVNPRRVGDGWVTWEDVNQIGNFAAGLQSIYPGCEFMRADCQPRETLGDGIVDAADWVQALRYYYGWDPITVAGLTAGATPANNAASKYKRPTSEVSVLKNTLKPGTQGVVTLLFKGVGDESALGCTMHFDPRVLTLIDFIPQSPNWGIINQLKSSEGTLSFVLIHDWCYQPFPPGQSVLVTLNVAVSPFAPIGSTTISFGDDITRRVIVNSNAQKVPANFVSGKITISNR